jgi:hypothetical protein
VGIFGDKLAMEIDGDIGWRAAIVGLRYTWASFLESEPLQTKRWRAESKLIPRSESTLIITPHN